MPPDVSGLRRPLCTAALLAGLGALPGLAGELEPLIQTSPLAGFQYHAGRALWPLMQVGDRLTLVREPDNPHDPKAIRVEWYGAMIGYAPRAENVDLARLMDGGVRVAGRIVHLQKARNPWKRVLFEVHVLPEPAAGRPACPAAGYNTPCEGDPSLQKNGATN